MYKMPAPNAELRKLNVNLTEKTWSGHLGRLLGKDETLWLRDANDKPYGVFMTVKAAEKAWTGDETVRENLFRSPSVSPPFSIMEKKMMASRGWAARPLPMTVISVRDGVGGRIIGLIFPQDVVEKFREMMG